MREIGINLHSDIAYKAFPEENPWHGAFHGGIFLKLFKGIPTANDYLNGKVA